MAIRDEDKTHINPNPLIVRLVNLPVVFRQHT